jgi:hypothetical protein
MTGANRGVPLPFEGGTPARRVGRRGTGRAIVATFAFALGAVACGSNGSSNNSPGLIGVGSSATPTPSGVIYTDPQGRWSATFAGKPKYISTTQASGQGKIPYLFAEYAAGDVDQFVGVLLIEPLSTFDFTKALQGVATGFSGTIETNVPETFRGYSAVKGVISAGTGFFECELVHSGGVVYIMGTAGTDDPPADFAGFLASVTLTPH